MRDCPKGEGKRESRRKVEDHIDKKWGGFFLVSLILMCSIMIIL